MTPYMKAAYAAVSTLIASLILVVPDGLTLVEGLSVAASVVAVTGGVYGLRNEPVPDD